MQRQGFMQQDAGDCGWRLSLVIVLFLFGLSAPAVADGPDMTLYERARAHEHGEGVERDLEKAARLYCEAAQLGDAESMFALGWMYANARGLERDDAAAAYLFSAAAEKGHDHAKRMLQFTGDDGQAPACLSSGMLLDEVSQSLEARLARLSDARRQVADLIVEWAPEYQISPAFALAIALTESALDPTALSHKNAQGVMQLIPETAARFNVQDAFDAEQNIKGGLAYLRWLLAYFEGNVIYAAAAYNAGEGAVERHGGVPPYNETRNYVKRIQTLFDASHHPFDATVAAPSRNLPVMRLAGQESN